MIGHVSLQKQQYHMDTGDTVQCSLRFNHATNITTWRQYPGSIYSRNSTFLKRMCQNCKEILKKCLLDTGTKGRGRRNRDSDQFLNFPLTNQKILLPTLSRRVTHQCLSGFLNRGHNRYMSLRSSTNSEAFASIFLQNLEDMFLR